MKYLIVGGVAGGATAAARLRRIDEFAEIILFEKGKYISYANCGLPYYIGGSIPNRNQLFLQTPTSFGNRFEVDVRIENEVLAIDRQQKELLVRDAHGKEYRESYDKLLLSPGAQPIIPPLEGIDGPGIFCLRNVDDTDRIKNYLQEHSVKKAAIVGAGFIGLEMAENLHQAGAEVSLIEMGPQVMAPLDFSMASLLHQHLRQKGVHLLLQEKVEGFVREKEGMRIQLNSGKSLEADLTILSIGVRPETRLAHDAGLLLGEKGGIAVDEYLQTSDPNIYAVGDAIEFPHPLGGGSWLNYLANPANRQGRLVADYMSGLPAKAYEGAIGTAIAKVFDLTVATTGLSAKRLQQMQRPYRSSITHGASHAGYYPNALPLSLKITFDPLSGKLLGAQGVGHDGVDKRIDQIALLIKLGGSIFDLCQLEHAYAPPFSSAKDPIAIAGYVASNILDGSMEICSWREMRNYDPEKTCLLDVRTPKEFAEGNIPGAINIPVDELRHRLDEIPNDRPIRVYCAVGLRGYLSYKILKANGFKDVKNLSGGYKTFATANNEWPTLAKE